MPVVLPAPNRLLDLEPAVAVGVAQRDHRRRWPAWPRPPRAAHQRDVEVAVGRHREMARGAEAVGDDEGAESRRQRDAAVVGVAGGRGAGERRRPHGAQARGKQGERDETCRTQHHGTLLNHYRTLPAPPVAHSPPLPITAASPRARTYRCRRRPSATAPAPAAAVAGRNHRHLPFRISIVSPAIARRSGVERRFTLSRARRCRHDGTAIARAKMGRRIRQSSRRRACPSSHHSIPAIVPACREDD